MSPAVNTLGTLVRLRASDLTLPDCVELDAELFEHPISLGPDEPHRQQDEVGGVNVLCAWLFDELRPPVLDFHLDSGPSRADLTRPFLPLNRLVMIEYLRLPPSSWADETRKTLDHCGHGLARSRLSGGRGTISN